MTNPATRIMYSIIYAGVTLAGCFTVIAGGLTVERLTSFLSYTNQYTKPFNESYRSNYGIPEFTASAARVFRFLDEEPETEEFSGCRRTDGDSGKSRA